MSVKLSQIIEKHNLKYQIQKTNTIQISYKDIIIDRLAINTKSIQSIRLHFCNLSSLQGIQMFTQLQQLSIKFNQISQFSQLLRISNKNKIKSLDLRGNQIQYLFQANFFNIINHFPNLGQLNGKIYEIPRQNSLSFRKLLKKTQRINKDLNKKMKKILKQNKIIQFQTIQPSNIYQQKNNYEPQQQDKQQLSLNNLSNIILTKSVRGSVINKKRPLQILTTSQSNQLNLPISQPTATFAQQVQKQNQKTCQFMFNRPKIKYDHIVNSILQSPQRQTIKTSRIDGNYQRRQRSYINFMSQSNDQINSLVKQQLQDNVQRQIYIADCFYLIKLQKKCLQALRVSRLNSLPVKISFS